MHLGSWEQARAPTNNCVSGKKAARPAKAGGDGDRAEGRENSEG